MGVATIIHCMSELTLTNSWPVPFYVLVRTLHANISRTICLSKLNKAHVACNEMSLCGKMSVSVLYMDMYVLCLRSDIMPAVRRQALPIG